MLTCQWWFLNQYFSHPWQEAGVREGATAGNLEKLFGIQGQDASETVQLRYKLDVIAFKVLTNRHHHYVKEI